MYMFYGEKGYITIINVMIISKNFSSGDVGRNFIICWRDYTVQVLIKEKFIYRDFSKTNVKWHILYIYFYKNEYWNNKHGTAQYNINELNITATEIYVWKKFPVSRTEPTEPYSTVSRIPKGQKNAHLLQFIKVL